MGAVKQYEATAHVSVPSFGLSTVPGQTVNAVPGSSLDKLLERRVRRGFKEPKLKLVGKEAVEHEEAARNFEAEMEQARRGMSRQVEALSEAKAESDSRVEQAIAQMADLTNEVAQLREQQVGLARENVKLREAAAVSEERAAALVEAEREITALRKKVGQLETNARRRKARAAKKKAPAAKKDTAPKA